MQASFLSYEGREGLYGGAAGGGKSVALLAASLQYADCPGYSALILRRTYKQLAKADSILEKAKAWLMGRRDGNGRIVRYNADSHKFTFPSGATLEFGHMENEDAKHNYQGGSWAFVGVDEATQFTEGMIAYPRTRQRRPAGSMIPIRWRGASNPGGVGHEYVKARYVRLPDGSSPATPDRQFFPATLADNPHIDREDYLKQLRDSGVDPVTLAQLERGDWDAVRSDLFTAESLSHFLDARPVVVSGRVRAWDKGYSAAGDYTVGVLMSRTPEGLFVIEDVVRKRCNPNERNAIIKATAEADDAFATNHAPPSSNPSKAKRVLQLIERPPGAGSETTATLIRMLAGHKAQAVAPRGDKSERAEPYAAQALAGNLRLIRAPWNPDFVSEHILFPAMCENDDQVDAAASAFNALTGRVKLSLTIL